MTEQEKKRMLIRAITLVKDLMDDMFRDDDRQFADEKLRDFYYVLNDEAVRLMDEEGVWV